MLGFSKFVLILRVLVVNFNQIILTVCFSGKRMLYIWDVIKLTHINSENAKQN